MSPPTTTRTTAPDGVSLAAYDWGGDGPPVLLCHPTGFHGRMWAPVVEQLVEAGRHAYSFDFRGHGDSDAPDIDDESYDWRHFANDALAVARHLDIAGDPALIAAGHSKGATSLLLGESDHPETYARIWAYEPIVFESHGGTSNQRSLANGAGKRRNEWSSVDEAYAAYARKPPLDSLSAESLRAYVDHALRDRGDGVLELKCRPEVEAQVYAMGPANGVWSRLADVHVPVTVACGEVTRAIGPKLAAEIVDRLADARLEVWDGHGHLGPHEDPARAARSILAMAQ